MFIIWSSPVGQMFHSTGSAVIQYSFDDVVERSASSVVPALAASAPPPAVPAASAAATFGGTASSLAWASTSICPSALLIFCPARVQKNMPPPSARNPRRSMSLPIAVRLLLDRDGH